MIHNSIKYFLYRRLLYYIVLIESTERIEEAIDKTWYKISTNAAAILRIKSELDGSTLIATVYSEAFNSGNRVYRYNTKLE